MIKNNPTVNEMVRATIENAPREACGVIGGLGGKAGVIAICQVPVANVHADPLNFFAMAERDQLDAWEQIEGLGMSVVGYWHSHIDAPAKPSGYDVGVSQPGLLSVILSYDSHSRRVTDMGVFQSDIPYGGHIFPT